ncbi:unnamed protein product [Chrysoparadoxa australica]
MNVVVLGGTGAVGRAVVRRLVSDDRLGSITAVVRRQLNGDEMEKMWETSSTEKLKQVVVPDLGVMLEEELPAELATGLKNQQAFISCLGLYTAKATETEMRRFEVEITSAAAREAKDGGATIGGYLSGQGVRPPSEKHFLKGPMFARVKGEAEDSLAEIFPRFCAARPGFISNREGSTPIWERIMNRDGALSFLGSRLGIDAADVASGLVQGTLFEAEQKHSRLVLEMAELKEAAKRYKESRSG